MKKTAINFAMTVYAACGIVCVVCGTLALFGKLEYDAGIFIFAIVAGAFVTFLSVYTLREEIRR